VKFKTGTAIYVKAVSVKDAKREAEKALCQLKGSAISAERGRL